MDRHQVNDREIIRSHSIGFLLSLILSVTAYFLVVKQWLTGNLLLTSIIVLAFIQAFIQFFCFMHLGKETKPRWNLATFLFMGLVLLMIVIGSLWIMENINYHMYD